jgi:hypothetical protein
VQSSSVFCFTSPWSTKPHLCSTLSRRLAAYCWGSWFLEASPSSGHVDDFRSAYGFGLAEKPSRYGFLTETLTLLRLREDCVQG